MAETTTALSPPKISDWLSGAPSVYIVIIGVATLNTLIVTVLSIVHLQHIHRHAKNHLIRGNLFWLGLLFPVTSICCVASMYVPRTADFLYIIGLTYIMLSLYFLVQLIINFFGSIAILSQFLYSKNIRIRFNQSPLCCCCRCLPSVEPSEINISRVTLLVLQSPIVRVVLAIIGIAILLEGVKPKDPVFTVLNVMGVVSMLLAVWGCQIIFALVREQLAPFGFIVVSRLVDGTQTLFALQKFIFDLAARAFQDDELMPAASKAHFWFNFVVTLEMLLFSVLVTILLRPARTRTAWQTELINEEGVRTKRTTPLHPFGNDMRLQPLNRSSPPHDI